MFVSRVRWTLKDLRRVLNRLNWIGGVLLEYDSKKLLHENEEKKHVSKSHIFQKLLLWENWVFDFISEEKISSIWWNIIEIFSQYIYPPPPQKFYILFWTTFFPYSQNYLGNRYQVPGQSHTWNFQAFHPKVPFCWKGLKG